MTACARRLENVLRGLGVQEAWREYTPHVTLFRVRDAAPRRDDPWTALHAHLERMAWPRAWIDRVVLWQSELHPQGARHVALAQMVRPVEAIGVSIDSP